jgi:hypothetical protein
MLGCLYGIKEVREQNRRCQMAQQSIMETGSSVTFTMEVEVPAEQVEAFREAMTGDDDDIILAAETAMRERVGRSYDVDFEEVEIGVPSEADVKEALRSYPQRRQGLTE